MRTIRQLQQDKADNEAKQARLRKEARDLPVAGKDRTPEQTARLDAIDAELTGLTDEAATIANDLARAQRYQDDERAEAQAIAARIQMGPDREAEKPISLGQFLQAVAYRVMPGMFETLSPAQKAAVASGASSGASSEGGFLVRSEWSTALMNKIAEGSQLLSKCFQLPIGEGFDGIEAPYVDETSRATGSRWGGVQVYRRAEAATVTATKPKLGRFELRLEDMMGIFRATNRVLRDATLLEGLVNRAFSSEFAFKLDDEIIRGDGAGKCLGVLNAPALVTVNKEGSQSADTILSQNVIKMYNRLLAKNIGRAEWYINQECLEQLHQMYLAVGTAGGQLTYMPANGLSASPYGTLLGRPVNVIETASGLGDAGDILFLDLSEYLVIQKPMEAASSMHVYFTTDENAFRWVWPIIGKPLMASAITPYKATSATTLSPFVALQAR